MAAMAKLTDTPHTSDAALIEHAQFLAARLGIRFGSDMLHHLRNVPQHFDDKKKVVLLPVLKQYLLERVKPSHDEDISSQETNEEKERRMLGSLDSSDWEYALWQ